MDKIAHSLEGLKGTQVNLTSTLHQENGNQQWGAWQEKVTALQKEPSCLCEACQRSRGHAAGTMFCGQA